VRWDQLFADLEAEADAADRAAYDADVEDRARSERARLVLADRLRAHVGARLGLRLIDGDRLTARLVDVGSDWLHLDDSGAVLVPLGAVAGVEGLTRSAAGEASAVARRVGLTVLLRRLARDRAWVRIRLRDGGTLGGTIDRVGADHVDLALHPDDEQRRASAVRGVTVLRLEAIVHVRAAP
jgi:hypothetical protein